MTRDSKYDELHERMIARAAAPSLLVGEHHQVVHLSEHAGKYLQQPTGEPTMNLFQLLREELRIELRAALHTTQQGGGRTRTKPVAVHFNGQTRHVWAEVLPSTESGEEAALLVVFHEVEPSSASEQPKSGATEEVSEARLRELETELDLSKQRLRTLSAELQNLLSATDIATLFLDRKLRILRFTPTVSELFNIRATDRSRPISDLTNRLGYSELEGDAQAVLESLVPVEREVLDERGNCYLTRVLPYRGVDDGIEGVVLTFVDITAQKEVLEEREAAQAALQSLNQALEQRVEEHTAKVREQEERFRRLVEASAAIIWTTDAAGIMVVEDSPSWFSFTGQSVQQWRGEGWADAVHPDFRDSVLASWRRSVAEQTTLDLEFPLRHAASGAWRWTNVRAVPLRDQSGRVTGWIGMNIDIDHRKRAEERLREMASRMTMAEQAERRRLAQIHHDDLQQLLYAIEIKLGDLAQDAREADQDALVKSAEQTRKWVGRALATTRRLTLDLSAPVVHETEDLVEALQWLRHQIKELHGLTVDLWADGTWQIADEDLRVLLFQTVRELLFNVKKHAGIDRAMIRLVEERGHLAIHVTDEGGGVDLDDLADRQDAQAGFGLFNARERLSLFGAHLTVASQPGRGTHIEIHLPADAAHPGSQG